MNVTVKWYEELYYLLQMFFALDMWPWNWR